jgi:hypothetical protein
MKRLLFYFETSTVQFPLVILEDEVGSDFLMFRIRLNFVIFFRDLYHLMILLKLLESH